MKKWTSFRVHREHRILYDSEGSVDRGYNGSAVIFRLRPQRYTSILHATWPNPKCHSVGFFKFSNSPSQHTDQANQSRSKKLNISRRKCNFVEINAATMDFARRQQW